MRPVSGKNIRMMVNWLENCRTHREGVRAAGESPSNRPGAPCKRDAGKQLEAIQREQRGFLTRVRQTPRPQRETQAKKTMAKRAGPRVGSQEGR
jgi:hypothetical protein